MLLCSRFSTYHPDPDASLIIPAFRLANMWNFVDLRTYLLPLAEKVLGDVDKIVFAREFGVEDWLAPAHTRLCQRTDAITSEEASKLGIESLLLILRTREANPTPQTCSQNSIYTHTPQICCNGYCGNLPFTAQMMSDDVVDQKVKAWIENGCVFAA